MQLFFYIEVYVTEFLIDECRGGQELILAALKLFQKLFKKGMYKSKITWYNIIRLKIRSTK